MKFVLTCFVCSAFFFHAQMFPNAPSNFQKNIKKDALEVLELKCNSCHRKKKRRMVFTFENMDAYGQKIYKQVIIKKRMPQKKAPQLTAKEYQHLKNWLETLDLKK